MKHDVYDQAAGAATADRSRTGDRGAASAPNQADMAKAVAAGKPGAGHKILEQLAGSWKGEVKCWMDPKAPPMESKAKAKSRWILGGRYLEEDFEGEAMGMPFHGHGLIGYDNVEQKYKSVWVDDMNSGMFCSQGKGDQKTITLEGNISCAATGRTNVPTRVVYKFQSPDRHTYEMFDLSRGETRTMEIVYTRV